MVQKKNIEVNIPMDIEINVTAHQLPGNKINDLQMYTN